MQIVTPSLNTPTCLVLFDEASKCCGGSKKRCCPRRILDSVGRNVKTVVTASVLNGLYNVHTLQNLQLSKKAYFTTFNSLLPARFMFSQIITSLDHAKGLLCSVIGVV
jgi:hypothetical protein